MTQHYPINTVAAKVDVTVDTLRYYEKQGLLFPVKRSTSGHRQFSDNDIEWIKFVLCLKSTGMPLEAIKAYRELATKGDETLVQRKAILEQHKTDLQKEISQLQGNLKTIEYKIDYYVQIEEDLHKIQKG